MNKKFNKFWTFIITLIILLIFVITCITALDVLNIIKLPEQYTLTRFLTTSKEIALKDYNNKTNEKNEDTVQTIVENDEKVKETQAPLPENLQTVYKQNYNNNNYDENQPKKEHEKYYYMQLNEYGKIIYNKMYSNLENLKKGTYVIRFDIEFNDLLQEEEGSLVLENAFQSSLNALIYDNPELFYIDITKMYLYTETTTIIIKKTYKVYIGPEEGKTYLADAFASKEEVETALNKVNEKVENIKQMITGTDYLKVKAVHNYLIDNIEYDQTISKPNIYNIYGALIDGVTVCEGYAKAFKYILNELGIDCMFVCGIGTNSRGETQNHAWNYINLGGSWYAVDVTWDDPLIIGGGILTDLYRYKYFLKGSNDFYNDHIEDGNIIDGVKFYYPVLSQNNY